MSTLIAFYSMTGRSRALARELREAIPGAVLEEIREPRPRRGLWGACRAMLDNLLSRDAPIEAAAHDPARFDLVLIGGPVWAGRMAAPVRAYARRYGQQAPRVAYFCTQDSPDPSTAFVELETLCARSPAGTLVVDQAQLPRARHAETLQRFARALAA